MMNLILAVVALQDYAAAPLEEAAPDALAAPVRAALASGGSRVNGADGKPYLDVWFRKGMPASDPLDNFEVLYTAVAPGTLVGAVRFHVEGRDYRDHKIAPGLYTLRYAWRPSDGDHQGATDTLDFLVLSRASDDGSAEALAPKALHEQSKKASAKKHPVVLFLTRADGDVGSLRHDDDKWILEAEIPGPGGTPFRFGLVVRGHAEEF